ncbi:urea amidolyase [Mucilaginibacter sp. PPCGB 2223]|uniref:5-oxoprolinase subunit C family protein n=1 Tax=Mucilaginibacter sp. PPCGB 2223 TaxID=1886027 RepID=UPI0008259055|nr:biotin-dependent carboxyltransferase family protein [Mucilaginibacter sp. PPCGB 2223]OCX51651.1 urea amidolyase [Mucilaginibacter sp. PPCGB 2223]
MKIQITKPGLLSTVQDLGRHGYQHLAVPVSGAMDTLSARTANMCVGNDANDAVIEFTYGDAGFKTETGALIAASGYGARLSVGARPIPLNKPVYLPAGLNVSLNTVNQGCRTYLSVAGGWDVPEVLGSRSTFLAAGFGGFEGRKLAANDVLNNTGQLSATAKNILDELSGANICYPKWSIPQRDLPKIKTIRVIPAREFNWFNGLSITNFLTEPYSLSQKSNRMGYQLNGPLMQRLNQQELLSTAVIPGTIQVTGDGSLIMLMADCQVTGGYPRIAQVALADMPLCAQLKPGDTIYFKEISWNEAEMLYIEQEKDIQKLAASIGHKYAF